VAALPHLAAATLEDYSLHNLTPKELEAAEHHLLICPTCCERLAGIEPFNVVHCTEEGLFYSRITRFRNGCFIARHWGCRMDGGRGYVPRSAPPRSARTAAHSAEATPDSTVADRYPGVPRFACGVGNAPSLCFPLPRRASS